MTGTLFVIAGIFFIGLGALNLLGITRKTKDSEGKAGLTKEGKLIELIRLAAADGTITENEHIIIYNKAKELNLDLGLAEAIIGEELDKVKGKEEVVIIDKNKQKGNQFEAYIVSRFNNKFFKLKEWAGDKYVNGLYAESTLHPDLKFLFNVGKGEQEFFVECKFKSKCDDQGIKWARDSQFRNYQKFEKKYNAPVFVAVGVGGEASDPDELFIIPLKEIKDTYVTMSFLKKFQNLKPKNTTFYFDQENLTLS